MDKGEKSPSKHFGFYSLDHNPDSHLCFKFGVVFFCLLLCFHDNSPK